MELRSAVEQLVFPSIQGGNDAVLLSLQRQFDESQWWSAERMKVMQLQQLSVLVDHAFRNVPFYNDRLRRAGYKPGTPMTAEIWQAIPILTRVEVRDLGAKLYAKTYPKSFGGDGFSSTGGSTGIPVRIRKTEIDGLYWEAAHLRELIWHCDDASGAMISLRGNYPESLSLAQSEMISSGKGLILSGWSSVANRIYKTGKMGFMSFKQPVHKQIEFLQKTKAVHLLIRPSSLRLLLIHIHENSIELPHLKYIWTTSERVDDSLRDLCKGLLKCKLIENYSAGETGYMALQCPEAEHLHVMSETHHLEILNAEGNSCAIGQIGRVIATPLHNFAMPLLRYEIGDEAERGRTCPCGRGLPVLNRILGRTGDYIITPKNGYRRVELNHGRLSRILAIKEFQLAQTARDRLELRLALARPLTQAEETEVEAVLQAEARGQLATTVTFHEALARTDAGKLKAFVSEL